MPLSNPDGQPKVTKHLGKGSVGEEASYLPGAVPPSSMVVGFFCWERVQPKYRYMVASCYLVMAQRTGPGKHNSVQVPQVHALSPLFPPGA